MIGNKVGGLEGMCLRLLGFSFCLICNSLIVGNIALLVYKLCVNSGFIP